MSSEKNTVEHKSGKELIRSVISNVPSQPGIYKMLDSSSKILYIGKAKVLKNRVYSYSSANLSPRIAHMVSNIYNIEFIVTKSEQDALILEADLIKKYQPRYNILLKDDKTFPFIKLDIEHNYPRVSMFRAKNGTPNKGMFGPFAGSVNLKEYIKLIQQTFLVRTCSDSFFKNREQPCVLYQIKRCSAPCVNKISFHDYALSIKQLTDFLKGNNQELKNDLMEKMNLAREQNNFEQAIIFRDRLKFLNSLNLKQSLVLPNNQNTDFICLIQSNSSYTFLVFTFRNGHSYGSSLFNPEITIEKTQEDLMEEFVLQYYDKREIPDKLIVNVQITNENKEHFQTLSLALKEIHKKNIIIANAKESNYQEVMKIVMENALISIEQKQKEETKWLPNFKDLAKYFDMQEEIKYVEVYDNSHLYGTLSLGVCIAANNSGFYKKGYKIFNLKGDIKGNDDYGILKEVLTRRFSKIKEGDPIPNLVLIDGGKGQFHVAKDVISSLGFHNIKIVGVSKGKNRNAGEETLILDNNEERNPDKYSPTLHFIQMLRNEAHRFAITSLRKRKLRTISASELDNIPGVGPNRKKILLSYFGSVEAIKNTNLEQLLAVKGIDKKILIKIFNWFH
jgi:excinuclease ABC subunit C